MGIKTNHEGIKQLEIDLIDACKNLAEKHGLFDDAASRMYFGMDIKKLIMEYVFRFITENVFIDGWQVDRAKEILEKNGYTVTKLQTITTEEKLKPS